MATLCITECSDLGIDKIAGDTVQAPFMPPVTEQTVAITGTTARSNPFNAATRFVMLETDTICSLGWASGNTATATTGTHRMAADEVRFYCVNPGGTVAVIT